MLTPDMGFIFLESQLTELAFKVLPHMIAKKTILWYGKTKKYLLLLVETAPAAFHEKGKLLDFGTYFLQDSFGNIGRIIL